MKLSMERLFRPGETFLLIGRTPAGLESSSRRHRPAARRATAAARDHRPLRKIRDLVEVLELVDDVQRPALHLDVDVDDVLADDAEDDELDAPEERNDDHDRGP